MTGSAPPSRTATLLVSALVTASVVGTAGTASAASAVGHSRASTAAVAHAAAPSDFGQGHAKKKKKRYSAPIESLAFLEASGWTLTNFDFSSSPDGDYGSLEWTSGDGVVELGWNPAEWYQIRVSDLDSDVRSGRSMQLLGKRAKEWHDDHNEHFTVRRPEDGYFLTFYGWNVSRARYDALRSSLRLVSTADLMAILPPEYLTPEEMPAAAAEMFSGITAASGAGWPARREVNVSKLVGYTRYNLGARVAGNYVCAWMEELKSAGNAADNGRVTEALRVLGTAHTWPILQEMRQQGAFPQIVWLDTGAAVKTGHVPGSFTPEGLGCV